MTVPSTALITGATAGIGAEFARQLAARGCNLVIIARDAERLEATAQALRATGVSVEVLAADLLAPEGRAAVEARVAAPDIDILVNNAGFGLIGTFDTNPIEDEQRHLDLLVTVPMRLMHIALQHMVAARRGTIGSLPKSIRCARRASRNFLRFAAGSREKRSAISRFLESIHISNVSSSATIWSRSEVSC